MVFIHLKENNQSILLAQVPADTDLGTVIELLVLLNNGRLRVERLCLATQDLVNYGVYKPFDQHGYQPDDLDKFINNNNNNNDDESDHAPGTIVVHEGREYLHNPDPLGKRNGLAPIHSLAITINSSIKEVMQAIHRDQVSAKVVMTQAKLNDLVDLLRGCVQMAFPQGIPEYDPVSEILSNSEDLNETIHAKNILDPNTSALWWAGKELIRGKALSDYVGTNDKTTIIAKLQKSGLGAPMREPPLCEQAQKDMMAYYYKKQEELKDLEDDDDSSFVHSRWANSQSLKTAFHGMSQNGISWHPR